MAGTAFVIAKTSLSSNGPSLGLWWDCNPKGFRMIKQKIHCLVTEKMSRKISQRPEVFKKNEERSRRKTSCMCHKEACQRAL